MVKLQISTQRKQALEINNQSTLKTLMTNYEKQATDFLEKTKTTLTIEFLKNDYHFADDKEKRDIYKITMQRGERKHCFNFGNSIADSGFYLQQGRYKVDIDKKYLELTKPELMRYLYKNNMILEGGFLSNDKINYPKAPTPYSILACLEKYDCGSFEDFCSNVGYDTDSRKAEKIYNAVKAEFVALQTLYNDEELEILREIN